MKLTHVLIVINLLVYAAMLGAGNGTELRHFSTHTLLVFGGNYAPLVREGEWWRAFTSMFIHITPVHIGMNMVALYQSGEPLEGYLGRARYLAVYLVAGLAGSAVSLAWHWHTAVVSAGASGAISGLIGAGAVIGQLIGTDQGRRYRDIMLRWGATVIVFGAVVGADNAAHLGGLLGGAAVAWLLARKTARPEGQGSLVLSSVLLLVVVAAGFAQAYRHRDAELAEDVLDRAITLAKAGKRSEAIPLYRRALAMRPTGATKEWEWVARYDLALALATEHEDDAAVDELQRAVAVDPSRAEGYRMLGSVLERRGRHDEAKAAFQRATELGAAPK